MKRLKLDSVSRFRSLHILMGLVLLYFLLITTQLPILLRFLDRVNSPTRENPEKPISQNPKKFNKFLSNLVFPERKSENSTIYHTAMQAWLLGQNLWARLGAQLKAQSPAPSNGTVSSCPETVLLSLGPELGRAVVEFPCGLTLGSHITVVGRARKARLEKGVMVSQFILEIRRLRLVVNGEEPERLLHFNPRIKGDWSGEPVIEMNNCYRGQWGSAVRCEGQGSPLMEETVDGQVKCEEWKHDDINSLEEAKAKWLEKLVGRREKAQVHWSYPFSEDKFFVLTVHAGLEGYHISVDGRHITSFAYRSGFDLEDAMALYVYGDVDIHSIFAASLPTSLPNVASERHLEMSAELKTQPLPNKPIVLFIGVISAGDHFVERMAVRKSWMQHHLIRSSIVVARFFVALHEKEAINVKMRKEAEFFGDIVIVPFLDNYDLVVLKTLAICEYGVNTLSTKYIMKCDDDTFVRVDAMIEETRRVDSEKSLYAGKLNYYHKPLRDGKWAVTHEEWPGEFYPLYADGLGYIVSSDIAHFIISEFEKNRLKLFKMEDVSMGMWVEQFNRTKPVEYLHNSQFYQFGCLDDYYTAHYQSPKQLICLWEKLQTEGKAICCNL